MTPLVLLSLLASCSSSSKESSGPTGVDSPGDTGDSSNLPPTDGQPNFIVLMGEARGWTSTSVLQDDRVPDSKSAIFLTPNLDDLAAEGMTFADFYAPSPRCMPSRAAYFVGKSPARLHMTFIPEGNKDGEVQGDVIPPTTETTLPTSEVTIAALLKEVGYGTAHFGKWHAGNIDPSEYGFDESDGDTTNKGPSGEEHPNPVQAFETADRGIDFMRRQVADKKPFYLQISHYGGGDPEDSLPETYAAESARLQGEDPDDIADAAIIQDMDTTVGMLLQTLQELGVAENTYVLFTADHGRAGKTANEPLTQGKGSVWEGGIRVPLLIRGPGIDRGSRSYSRATQVDLYPTIAELAQVSGPLPENLEGGSLWPLLSNASTEVERPFEEFVVHYPHYDKDPLGPASAILLGDEKLIRFYEDGSLHLYNLADDLAEEHDLAPSMPERARELEARMDNYLTAVGAQMPGHR